MKVKELIEFLKSCNPDGDVTVIGEFSKASHGVVDAFEYSPKKNGQNSTVEIVWR